MPNLKRSAFTILELSIVIAVMALMMGGIVSIWDSNLSSKRTTQIKTTMDTIEASLISYRKANGRLPCPAGLTDSVASANFGAAQYIDFTSKCIPNATTAGTCMGSTPKRCQLAANVAMGMVPTKTLGLPEEMAFDPWGGRIDYVVDEWFTDPNAFAAFPVSDTYAGNITVKDKSDTAMTLYGIAALVSHGSDGHGAYLRSGSRKSLGYTNALNAQEGKNCHCDKNGADSSLDATFYQSNFYQENSFMGGSGWSAEKYRFDDSVRYYNRSAFISANYTSDTIPAFFAEYKMNEASGTRADSSGYARDLTATGVPTTTTGVRSSISGNLAVVFNGTTQYLSRTDDTFNIYPLSVAFWVKTADNTGTKRLVGKYASNNGWQVYMTTGNVYGSYNVDGSNYVAAINGGAIANNTWHHVAYVVGPSGGKIYVDGVQAATAAWTLTKGVCTTTQDVTVAYIPSGAFTAATIDDLRISNTVFTDAQVGAEYDHGLGRE